MSLQVGDKVTVVCVRLPDDVLYAAHGVVSAYRAGAITWRSGAIGQTLGIAFLDDEGVWWLRGEHPLDGEAVRAMLSAATLKRGL